MKTVIAFFLTLSFIQADEKMVASIAGLLQQVMDENSKHLEDIDINYDPFNEEKPKVVEKIEPKDNNNSTKVTVSIPSEPQLSMILNKKAFINDDWYKVGDKFADYRVTRINQDIVVLRKNKKYTTLRLPVSEMILITKEEIE